MANTHQQTSVNPLRGGLYSKVAQVLLLSLLVFASLHKMRWDAEDLRLLRVAQALGTLLFVLEVLNSPRDLMGRIWHGHRYKVAIYLLLFTIGVGSLCRAVRGMSYFYDFVYVVVGVGVALTIVNRRVSFYTTGIAFYAVAITFAIRMFQGLSSKYWLANSNNHVSIILLALGGLYVLHRYLRTGVVDLIPAGITFFFSLIALGRGGIISSGVFLLGLFACKMTNRRGIYSIMGFGLPFLLAMAFYGRDILDNLMFHIFPVVDHFDAVGLEAGTRMFIINFYTSNLDALSFFVGSDIDFLSSSHLELSSHNSYLSWHMKFGCGAFFLFGYCIFALARMFYKSPVHFVILLTAMMRGATDDTLIANNILPGLPFVLALISEGMSAEKTPARSQKAGVSNAPVVELGRKTKMAPM